MEEFRKKYVYVPTQEPTRNTAVVFSRVTFICHYVTQKIQVKYTQLTASSLSFKITVRLWKHEVEF